MSTGLPTDEGRSPVSRRRQRGTGTVIEYPWDNGDVSYRIQFYDGKGKQAKLTVGRKSQGWTRAKAEAELRNRINEVVQRGWAKPKPTLFGDYAVQWLTKEAPIRGWDDNTLRSYRGDVSRLTLRFGKSRLTDIKRKQVNDYSADLLKTLAPATVGHVLTVFRMILESAVLDELIDSNPANKAKRPKVPRYKPRALTPDEAARVLKALTDPQCRLAYLTFLLLGIRFCELRTLRWRDLKMVEKRIRITDSKTEAGEREQAVPSVLIEEFMEQHKRMLYTRDSDYIFQHPHSGARWHERFFRDAMKKALAEAGIEGSENFRPAHDLRVTSITNGILAGEHPVKLMHRVGHKSFNTTKGYVNLAGEVFHEEADALAERMLGGPVGSREASEALS